MNVCECIRKCACICQYRVGVEVKIGNGLGIAVDLEETHILVPHRRLTVGRDNLHVKQTRHKGKEPVEHTRQRKIRAQVFLL